MSFRGQLVRLRRLAEEALAQYDIEAAELVLLAHDENTTFRAVASDGERYVLRIHRVSGSPFHLPRSIDEVRSVMLWLSALRRDTDLAVPEPVVSNAGSIVTVAEVEGTPPRICALFGWQPGRFLDAGLTPRYLERVGELTARLHDHAGRFTPPSGFTRWQRCDVSDDVAAYVAGAVRENFGAEAASIVEDTIDAVRQAQDELGTTPGVF